MKRCSQEAFQATQSFYFTNDTTKNVPRRKVLGLGWGGESGESRQEGGAARSPGREGDTPVELQPRASGITSHTLLLTAAPQGDS